MLLLSLTATALVPAQVPACINLHWRVAGGRESSSASYNAAGTSGQSLAGPLSAAGSSYAVSSGYWAGGAGLFAGYIEAVACKANANFSS